MPGEGESPGSNRLRFDFLHLSEGRGSDQGVSAGLDCIRLDFGATDGPSLKRPVLLIFEAEHLVRQIYYQETTYGKANIRRRVGTLKQEECLNRIDEFGKDSDALP